jgi:hypothetical protein
MVAAIAMGKREIDRSHRGNANRARGQEVKRVRITMGVVALEDGLARRLRELAQARHDTLGLLICEQAAIGVAKEAEQVRKGMVHRRSVGLAADVVMGIPGHEVQCAEDVQGACAGGWVAADLGIAGLLVLAVVRLPNHCTHLGEGALGNGLEERCALGGVGVGIHRAGSCSVTHGSCARTLEWEPIWGQDSSA